MTGQIIAYEANELENRIRAATRTGTVGDDFLEYVSDKSDYYDDLVRSELLPMLSSTTELAPGEEAWLRTLDTDLARIHSAVYTLHGIAEDYETDATRRDELSKRRKARAVAQAERPRLMTWQAG